MSFMPPRGTVPGVVPWRFVIARSPLAVASLRAVVAYPDGFDLVLHLHLRGRLADDRRLVRRTFLSDDERPETLRLAFETPDGPLEMSRGGGSGNDERLHLSHWVTPLPGRAPVTLTFAWPIAELGPTTIDLDGSEVTDAAARAVVVWEEPEP